MGNARNLGSLLNTSSTIQADDLNIGQLGNRNLIINGAMQVWQRATSASGLTAASFATVDRFHITYGGGSPGGSYTVERSTDTPSGFNYSMKVTHATASTTPNEYAARTFLEMQNIKHLWGNKIAYSFYYKSNRTGTHAYRFSHNGITGAVTSNGEFTVNAADTWERKEIILTNLEGATGTSTGNTAWGIHVDAGPVMQGEGLGTFNSGDYFAITGVQLELGDKVTPFEHRSYGQELALCQRYFQAHGDVNFQGWNHNIADTGGTRTQAYSFPVTMRATPSITYRDNVDNAQRIYAEYPNSTSGNNITFNFYANNVCMMGFKYPYGNLYGSNGDSYMISANDLYLDAEL